MSVCLSQIPVPGTVLGKFENPEPSCTSFFQGSKNSEGCEGFQEVVKIDLTGTGLQPQRVQDFAFDCARALAILENQQFDGLVQEVNETRLGFGFSWEDFYLGALTPC